MNVSETAVVSANSSVVY